MRKYLNIIKNDLNYTSADVLAFAESRLRPSILNEEISIHGFQEVIRNDLKSLDGNDNAMHGTAIYIRKEFIVHSTEFHSTLFIEWSLLNIRSPYSPTKMIQLVFMYVKNDCRRSVLKSTLEHIMTLIDKNFPYLIVGDFNINEYDYTNEAILEALSNITSSKQLVPQCTTEYNTKIDLAYGNVTSVGVISSMIAYHSLITAQIDCKSTIPESISFSPVNDTDVKLFAVLH